MGYSDNASSHGRSAPGAHGDEKMNLTIEQMSAMARSYATQHLCGMQVRQVRAIDARTTSVVFDVTYHDPERVCEYIVRLLDNDMVGWNNITFERNAMDRTPLMQHGFVMIDKKFYFYRLEDGMQPTSVSVVGCRQDDGQAVT